MPSFEEMMEEVKRKKESLSKPRTAPHQPSPEAGADDVPTAPAAATMASTTTTTTVAAVLASERRMEEKEKERRKVQHQNQKVATVQPHIQPSPSAGGESMSGSLAYSVETSATGEVSAEHHHHQHQQHQQQHQQHLQHLQHQQHHHQQYESLGGQGSLATMNEYYYPDDGYANALGNSAAADEDYVDATSTVCDMHRKLLYLLSHPELFAEAMEWQSKVDRGIDPSRNYELEVGGGEENGIRSFDNEFNDTSKDEDGGGTGMDETKDGTMDEGNYDDDDDGDENSSSDLNRAYVGDDTRDEHDGGTVPPAYDRQAKLIPPLPLRIFASDAEVVLPQAYTATQLFGIERITGIELEAAGGISGLCQLFQRWLALMPMGDHENAIDPPGVTVMRISGGRYRVTGAHRVVWRWMNKFSFPDLDSPRNKTKLDADKIPSDEDAADFDFGDLVTMTIIDVFETDSDGRLLSYCPTFDNRAVHKTQEVTERIRKGASLVKERMEVVARSPAGKSVNKATHDLGKMSINAALAVGNIVKRRIEEEMHKRETRGQPDAFSDAEEMVDAENDAKDEGDDDDDDKNATENAADRDDDDDGSSPAEV
ncbi:hypothetical protein ACHAXA_001703 [Cyclostephanos tholiformis]|uniref:Uncharacterized protein n=1 Tax=Cyclostephanos tholiformis TaxID=382380 RepID=A0ABD3R3H3_9STRA